MGISNKSLADFNIYLLLRVRDNLRKYPKWDRWLGSIVKDSRVRWMHIFILGLTSFGTPFLFRHYLLCGSFQTFKETNQITSELAHGENIFLYLKVKRLRCLAQQSLLDSYCPSGGSTSPGPCAKWATVQRELYSGLSKVWNFLSIFIVTLDPWYWKCGWQTCSVSVTKEQ
jgi:hypothetical protein